MIKTALIGLGRIGWQFHLPEILRHCEYSLVAVVDPLEARLNEAKDNYNVRGYTDHTAMLEAEKPNLVVIASPTMFHEEQTLAAFAAGCDVLLDKPMSYDLASAKRIADAAKQYGKKLTVYQPHRFTSDTQVAKRIIDSGILGELTEIRCCRCQYVRRNDWQAFKKHGGGMLNNYGAHHIDQAVYLAQDKVKNMICSMRNVAGLGDAEDMVRTMMVTEKGIVLDVTINQAAALPLCPLMVFGKHGAMSFGINYANEPEYLVKYFVPEELSERTVDEGLAAPGRAYPSEVIPWKTEQIPILPTDALDYYETCADYFGGNGDAPVSIEETLYTMELMEQCRAMGEV